MSKKTAVLPFLFSIFLSGLSVLLCFKITGWKGLLVSAILWVLAGTLLLTGDFFVANSVLGSYSFRLILLLSLAVALSTFALKRYETALGLPQARIVALEGRMIYDSSFSSSGKGLVRISVQKCWDSYGNCSTAKGLVTAVGDEKALASCALTVRLEGNFSEDLFIYNSFQVIRRSRVNNFREYLIERLESRLYGSSDASGAAGPDEPALLSSLLLLGRAEDYDFPLKDLAQDCGCSHVLALSGMHLSVLASLCTIFGKSKWAKALSFLVISAFVFVAGPRPSLIRAAIMYCLGKRFNVKQRVVLAFLLQCLLLPFTMLDLGCCYGYVAVFAIVFLWELLRTPVAQLVRSSWVSPLFLSISVLLLCAPVQLLQSGTWCPVSILVSPLASLLITFSMLIGMFILSFGRLQFLVWLNNLVYTALTKLFTTFGKFPKAGWRGYVIMVALVVALEIFCLFYRKRQKAKVKEYHFTVKFDLNLEELD